MDGIARIKFNSSSYLPFRWPEFIDVVDCSPIRSVGQLVEVGLASCAKSSTSSGFGVPSIDSPAGRVTKVSPIWHCGVAANTTQERVAASGATSKFAATIPKTSFIDSVYTSPRVKVARYRIPLVAD